jgi:excisionase family DNA binding protein
MNTTQSLTYSVEEVAALLGIARGVAYECVRNGSIPATRVGRRWLVPRKRFHAWLDGDADATSTTGSKVA